MLLTPFLFAAALIWSTSTPDETVRAYGGAERTWVLSELNGTAFEGRATITFPEVGIIAGQAPCNRYRTTLTIPYPWFGVGPIAATRMACPDLASETAFFAALEAATISLVADDTLTLSTETDVVLVFKADD